MSYTKFYFMVQRSIISSKGVGLQKRVSAGMKDCIDLLD